MLIRPKIILEIPFYPATAMKSKVSSRLERYQELKRLGIVLQPSEVDPYPVRRELKPISKERYERAYKYWEE